MDGMGSPLTVTSCAIPRLELWNTGHHVMRHTTAGTVEYGAPRHAPHNGWNCGIRGTTSCATQRVELWNTWHHVMRHSTAGTVDYAAPGTDNYFPAPSKFIGIF